jgi:hypothetical protein
MTTSCGLALAFPHSSIPQRVLFSVVLANGLAGVDHDL